MIEQICRNLNLYLHFKYVSCEWIHSKAQGKCLMEVKEINLIWIAKKDTMYSFFLRCHVSMDACRSVV
jgi:hypothetical protein